MSDDKRKLRGEAYTGKGYGGLRYRLFVRAREHIERSMELGFHCEAIAIIESVITDRLESRLSYLDVKNHGFKTLGSLVKDLRKLETDTELLALLDDVNGWRKARNGAIHELTKVEADVALKEWDDRLQELARSSVDGYALLKRLYHRIADLNPLHTDRAFPKE